MLTLELLLSGDSELIRTELMTLDLDSMADIITNSQYRNFFKAGPGREHYKLLAAASNLYPNHKVYDIGTHFGLSALAMSMNPDVKVVSYDIADQKQLSKLPPNIEFKYGDFRHDPDILSSPLIFIDVDPHDPPQEYKFHEFFVEKNYKGIIFWDDVFSSPELTKFWDSIGNKKFDLTNAGHWSGTGMVVYE